MPCDLSPHLCNQCQTRITFCNDMADPRTYAKHFEGSCDQVFEAPPLEPLSFPVKERRLLDLHMMVTNCDMFSLNKSFTRLILHGQCVLRIRACEALSAKVFLCLPVPLHMQTEVQTNKKHGMRRRTIKFRTLSKHNRTILNTAVGPVSRCFCVVDVQSDSLPQLCGTLLKTNRSDVQNAH